MYIHSLDLIMQIKNGCEAELLCLSFDPLLEVSLFTVLWSYMWN